MRHLGHTRRTRGRGGRLVSRALVAALVAGAAAAARASVASAQGPAPAPPPQVTTTAYDMSKVAAPSALSPGELKGKRLFVQRCALCHDLLGQPAATTVGPWVDGTTVKTRGDEAIRQKINNGSRRMPGWKYTLDAQQVDSVIAYLKTVTPDMRPKPGGPITGPIE